MSSNGTTKKMSEIKRKKASVSRKRKVPSSKKALPSSKGKSTKAKSDSKSPRSMAKNVASRSNTPLALKSSASSQRGQPQDRNEGSSHWSHPEPMPEEHRRILLNALESDGTVRTRIMGRLCAPYSRSISIQIYGTTPLETSMAESKSTRMRARVLKRSRTSLKT